MANDVYEVVCKELHELDEKARNGKIELRDIEYADKLEHLKKSILTNRAMEGQGYSESRGSYNASYAGQPRDSMGRYRASYADHSLADGLRRRAGMERDEMSRREMERMADRLDMGA